MIPIFLSRPNPFTLEQDYFLSKILELLKANNIEPITLKAKDYNPYESLSCLDEMIKRCYGMIILAFGQTYINEGISKKGSITKENFFESYENNLEQTWITSPFCHIEGALAFSNKLPIFILNQDGVKLDGILKEGTHAVTAPSFCLHSKKNIDTFFDQSQYLTDFNNWKQQISQLYNFINNSNIIQ